MSRTIAPAVCALAAALGAWSAEPAQAAVRVVIIEGLGGEATYAQQFAQQGAALAAASRAIASAEDIWVWSGPDAARDHILAGFHRLARALHADDRLILYLVGHGSFDGRQYKFNLPGPDLSDTDLKSLLDALPTHAQLVVATGSASGALLSVLGAPHRVLLTATRNGDEKNATHLGAALVDALRSGEADRDKDGRISLPEAYAFANREVQDSFRRQTLLASEHAVLQGADAAGYTLASVRPTARGAAGSQGGAAQSAGAGGALPATPVGTSGTLLQRREVLNAQIHALEARKDALSPDAYQSQLQTSLLQLAQLQQQIDSGDAAHAKR